MRFPIDASKVREGAMQPQPIRSNANEAGHTSDLNARETNLNQ